MTSLTSNTALFKQTVLGCVLFLFFGGGCRDAGNRSNNATQLPSNRGDTEQEQDETSGYAKEPEQWPRYRWELMSCFDNSISSVHVSITDDDARHYTTAYKQQVHPVDFTISEGFELKEFTLSFCGLTSLCSTLPDHCIVGTGQLAHGRMRLTTSKGEITVWVSREGFSLEEQMLENHTRFFSTSLANWLKLMYEERTSQPFPNEFFETLCGLRYIQLRMKNYAADRQIRKERANSTEVSE